MGAARIRAPITTIPLRSAFMSTPVSGLPFGRGLLYLAVAGAAWGTAGAAADLIYRSSAAGPITVSFWRNVAGLVLLLAVQLIRSRGGGPAAGWVAAGWVAGRADPAPQTAEPPGPAGARADRAGPGRVPDGVLRRGAVHRAGRRHRGHLGHRPAADRGGGAAGAARTAAARWRSRDGGRTRRAGRPGARPSGRHGAAAGRRAGAAVGSRLRAVRADRPVGRARGAGSRCRGGRRCRGGWRC